MGITLVVLFLFLLLSASFSSFETALFSLTPLQRYRLKEAGGVSSLITRILDRPRELLTTVLFGNELVNVAIAILAGSLAYGLFSGIETRTVYLLSTGVTTLVLLIAGEIVPKNVAIRIPLIVSQVLVVPYQLFAWLVSPFRLFFTKIADWIVRLSGADPGKARRLIVEEELRNLIELGKTEGTLADLEQTLLQNALDLSRLRVSQVMTPRQRIVAVPVTMALGGILKTLDENRYSRLPVYEGDLNHIIGILHAKELLPVRLKGDRRSVGLREMLKQFATVSAEETLDYVFQEFQRQKIHMGIVTEGTGQVVGLITMDDLLRRFFP